MYEVSWEDEARITTIRVHKDSEKHDQVLPLDNRAFFAELEQTISSVNPSPTRPNSS